MCTELSADLDTKQVKWYTCQTMPCSKVLKPSQSQRVEKLPTPSKWSFHQKGSNQHSGDQHHEPFQPDGT